jgi:multiple sugar transport system ATP-binding protein
MDEPLSNLDAKLRVQMRTEIAKLHQRLGTTIIYVTHDQTEAMTLGSRIVVMKDGVVQQIDSPQNLYDKPDNLFVAGFMGSPQMNFIDAVARVNGNSAALEVAGQTIPLPADKAKAVVAGGYNGKTVVLGIRPENILETTGNEEYAFKSTCNVYELLGAEVFLYFDLEGANITARVEPTTKVRPGDTVSYTFDTKKIHIFDKETEKVIAN